MDTFENINFSILSYIYLFFGLSAIIFIRYIFSASLYHVFVYSFFKKRGSERIVQHEAYAKSQIWKEIWRSGLSSFIFSFFAILMVIIFLEGYSKIYLDWSDYPIWYHPISIIAILFLQDSYYYWLHRWMHIPSVYRKIHQWHHDSIHTNSMTSFSFHPYETVLQAVLIPILIMTIPMHLFVGIGILLFMTLSAIINHGAVEIYPQNKYMLWFRQWFIGATHHHQHHIKFNTNYGLYFTFWDRLMNTEKLDFNK